jgi:hypothetical protein
VRGDLLELRDHRGAPAERGGVPRHKKTFVAEVLERLRLSWRAARPSCSSASPARAPHGAALRAVGGLEPRYVRRERKNRALVAEIEGSELPHAREIANLLRKGGTRSGLFSA